MTWLSPAPNPARQRHGATLDEIARELGMTKSLVQKIIARALRKLRASGLRHFRDWLEHKGVDHEGPASVGRANDNGHRWRGPAPGAK